MVNKRKTIGIRCVECGCILDHGERCDCEQRTAERREEERRAKSIKAIKANEMSMAQARREWEYA